jgi:hypothetical protein
MWTHGIKRFAGSTIVAGALLATALASHAQATTPCKLACLKQFRNETKMCVLANDCGSNFAMCRIDDCGGIAPGPGRSSCLANCRSQRLACRQAVVTCKAGAVSDLSDCKDACNNP